MTQTTNYQPGDEIDVNGTTIMITTWKGCNGVRYGWYAPAAETGGEGYKATPAEAVNDAYTTLGGPRCSCGEPATMNASTRRTCAACYDRHAG